MTIVRKIILADLKPIVNLIDFPMNCLDIQFIF